MSIELITKEDLQDLKKELLQEFKQLLKERPAPTSKKWMRSNEVRQLLEISPGTLQNLRVNGKLPYSKVGGVIYYHFEDIRKMLKKNKVNGNS